MPLNTSSLLSIDDLDSDMLKPLIIEARTDGTGARLTCMLNAMYHAKKYNCRFGFVWHKRDDKFTKEIQERGKKDSYTGIYVESEDKIFSKDFLKKYSYTKIIKQSNDCQLNDLEKGILSEIWGWYICRPSKEQLKLKKPYESYPDLWKQIRFSDEITNVFKKAKKDIEKLNDYIAIHCRSGDILSYSVIRKGPLFYVCFKQKRVVPVEILVDFIKSKMANNLCQNILLLGDDISLIKMFKKLYHNNIYTIDDIYINSKIRDEDCKEEYKKVYYDLSIMSEAKEVYSSYSAFANLSTITSRGELPKQIFANYSLEMQYAIISENLHKYDVSIDQKIYSSVYLFLIGLELNKDVEVLEKYIDYACENDLDNSQFHLAKIFIFIKQNKLDQANEYIYKNIAYFGSIELFMSNYKSQPINFFAQLLFDNITSLDTKYVYLVELLDFIIKKSVNAKFCYKKIVSANNDNLDKKYKKDVKFITNPFKFFQDSKNPFLKICRFIFINESNKSNVDKKDVILLCNMLDTCKISGKKKNLILFILAIYYRFLF